MEKRNIGKVYVIEDKKGVRFFDNFTNMAIYFRKNYDCDFQEGGIHYKNKKFVCQTGELSFTSKISRKKGALIKDFYLPLPFFISKYS